MDLKQYYRKLREVQNTLAEPFPVMVSLETSDGGRGGVVSEVTRETAAKLIVEGRAVVASEEEKEAFLRDLEAKRRIAEKLEMARRVQVAIIADPELQNSVTKKNPGNGR